MPPAATVPLAPGAVFRTAALRRWGENPTRLSQRLERDGLVQRLGHGLLFVPKLTKFGAAAPSDSALLDALLDGGPYVITGPIRWNALGLGSTGLYVHPLVYNTKRTCSVTLGGRTFNLRRVAFPREVTAEWFVVDLLRHTDAAGLDPGDLIHNLVRAVKHGRFDRARLMEMAERFGTVADAKVIRGVVEGAAG